jgi:hypothetical protein
VNRTQALRFQQERSSHREAARAIEADSRLIMN